MAVERMSPLDATFLHVEDDVTHMHIASTLIFEGPAPRYEDLLSMIAGKLELVEKYRKVVQFVPLNLGRPVWVDDPHFHLEYHVRHTALPAPGSNEDLRRLIGRVMSQQLDRNRPLWELWMVEGLENGHWAIMSKVHHCMVDGVSGTELLSIVLDVDPDPPRPAPAPWYPREAPSKVALAVEAVGAMATSPFEQMRAVRSATRVPRHAFEQLRHAGQGLAGLSGVVRPTVASSLNGPIGPHRRYDWADDVGGRHQARPQRSRRHVQRCRAGCHHGRVSCAARVEGRAGRPGAADDGARIGASA